MTSQIGSYGESFVAGEGNISGGYQPQQAKESIDVGGRQFPLWSAVLAGAGVLVAVGAAVAFADRAHERTLKGYLRARYEDWQDRQGLFCG